MNSSFLKTISINAAPLRDHISDLFLYIERFGLEFTAKNDIPFKGFSQEAINLMKKYNWPGNIRELKNTIESLLAINRGERIQDDMVSKYLKLDPYISNDSLPVPVNGESDIIEREKPLTEIRGLLSERETRFELATSTLARWCSTS